MTYRIIAKIISEVLDLARTAAEIPIAGPAIGQPENTQEHAAFALGTLAQMFQTSCVLFAGAADAFGNGTHSEDATAEEIAERLGVTALSARLLLNALCACGVSRCENGLYGLREDLRPLLASGAIRAEELLLYRRENEIWLHLASVLRGDQQAPVEYRRELLDSRIGRYPGVQAMNRWLARGVLDQIGDLTRNARRVLDIGGGDGVYCQLLLERNPDVIVRVLDLESGFELCSRLTEHLHAGRLQLEVGDARSFHSPPQYDLVMINELLELFPRAEKRLILKRALQSLRPGGHLVVTKFTLHENSVDPGASALFSLRMRLKTLESYLETDREVMESLTEYGCGNISLKYVESLKSVISAKKMESYISDISESSILESAPGQSPRLIALQRNERKDDMQATELSEAQLGLWRELVGGATSFRLAAVLFAAAELDLFTHIPPEGCTAAQMAQSLAIPELGVHLLMNALSAIGILALEDGRYTLHADLRVLLAQGPHCVLPEILQYRRENQVWLRLLDILRNNSGARADAAHAMEAGHLPEYLTSVKMTNHGPARDLARRLAPLLSGSTSVLDIGGGAGDYARLLLAAGPDVTVTLFDRPEVIAQDHAVLDSAIQNGRVKLVAGDALDFQLPPTHDVALMSDLLHYFSYEDKRRIILNAKQALAPGGSVVVSKFTLDSGGIHPPSAALFSLKLHVKRSEAYLETDHEVVAIMQSVGLESVVAEPLNEIKSVIIGRRGTN